MGCQIAWLVVPSSGILSNIDSSAESNQLDAKFDEGRKEPRMGTKGQKDSTLFVNFL